MSANNKTEQGTGYTATDQVGKAFVVVDQRVRRCLVCEELFTRRAARDHAMVPCMPGTGMQPGRK